MNSRVAVIDLGTNTARLLIADRSDGAVFRHVCLEREIVRMGGGFCRERGLSADAVERGLACLERFSVLIQKHGAGCVRAVATSAVRDAVNGPAFLKAVQCRTGITLQAIDGIREGRLTLAGVLAGLDRMHDNILLFDVGGGSTEYTLVRKGEASFIRSLPLGVVRLTEGKGTVAAIERKIVKELEALRHDMEKSKICAGPDTVLIGTAGTATTLAAISLEMNDYDYRRVNNYVISKSETRSIYERLLPLSLSERLSVPGLEKGREDLIIAGSLITLRTMDLFGSRAMKVSDYGLLEGLVVSGNDSLA